MKKETKELAAFSIASFMNDLGSDMIYPIWPLFVTSFLGANMFILGLLDGIGDAVVSLSKGASGYISDRTGKRKVFIYSGYFLAFMSRIGYAFSSLWWHLVPLKILDRAGKIRGAPRDAIISEISHNEKGRNFGLLRTMDNLGAVVGIIISIVLIRILSLRQIFLIAAIPSLVSVLIILIFIREGKRGIITKRVSVRMFNSRYKWFLSSLIFLSLATFSYSFLLIFANQAGLSQGAIPVLYLVFTMLAAISSYPAGRIADAIGTLKVLVIGMLIYLAMLISFILVRDIFLFYLLFALYGIFKGITDTLMAAYASKITPKEMAATGIGGAQLVSGVFALPASSLAGLAWLYLGRDAPFIMASVFLIISLLLLSYSARVNPAEP